MHFDDDNYDDDDDKMLENLKCRTLVRLVHGIKTASIIDTAQMVWYRKRQNKKSRWFLCMQHQGNRIIGASAQFNENKCIFVAIVLRNFFLLLIYAIKICQFIEIIIIFFFFILNFDTFFVVDVDVVDFLS